VPVPAERRTDPEFADLRRARAGLVSQPRVAADWIFSLQVSKTLPLDGRLSFYAFNAFDRVGRYGTGPRATRLFPAVRFGLDVSMPAAAMLAALQ
jgi:hypothetical protein